MSGEWPEGRSRRARGEGRGARGEGRGARHEARGARGGYRLRLRARGGYRCAPPAWHGPAFAGRWA
eukprot:scaffold112166_cov24-Phaeocystis_antarctica.AAC.1